eukprot:symbB.v1.2.019173.t2/scaffold1559.1/size111769/6
MMEKSDRLSTEVYSFASYLASHLAFLVWLIWVFLPDEVLHSWGITYYPDKWWAVAVPVYLIPLASQLRRCCFHYESVHVLIADRTNLVPQVLAMGICLDLVESFALEQARLALREDKTEKKSGRKASGKVTCLECLSTAGSFILAGSECGCELWQLTKSRERRINTSKLRGLEYHLQLNLVKQITTEPVYRIVCSAEQRVIVAGYKTLVVLDNELTLVASCNMPFVCSAHLHMLSSSQAEMITGMAFDAPGTDAVSDGLCTRLEHTFYGHTRPVEMVCFYNRPEKSISQRFAVSCGLDLRVQVWSLDNFICIYTLDINLSDSKAHVFPISLHLFAVSYTVGSSTGDSQKGASVALIRFNVEHSVSFQAVLGSFDPNLWGTLGDVASRGIARTILLLTVCAPAFVPPIFRAVPSRQETFCRSKAENEGLPSNSRITEGFFPYRYDNFQRDPQEVWSVWEAAVPDEETKLFLAKLELPEAARWALLTESLRWAARGHDFLRTWTRAAQDLPKESTAVCFSQRSASTSSASSLIRLAVSALAEMLSRSSQAMEKSELCALLWFLEFTLSKQAREEKHISDMQSALREVLQDERLTTIQPGCKGSDLPACVGDVLTVIHDSCTALGIECPWQKELDGHLDLVLFVNLVYAFEKEKKLWMLGFGGEFAMP